jgi:hypothetical protein
VALRLQFPISERARRGRAAPADGGGWSSETGKQSGGTDMKVDFDYDWSSSTSSFCSGQHRFCDGLIAVHEFGHALGFDHEQVRPDNASEQYCDEWQDGETTDYSGTYLTDSYDTDSIMSYCAQWDRSTPHVSEGDVEGIHAAYGAKPNNITDQVLLYEDHYYSGKTVALRPGSYDLSTTTLGNDALTSLRIPSGWSVRVYQDSSTSGAYLDFTGDVPSLVDYGFSDVASNITVTGTVSTYAQIYGNTSYGGSNQKLYPGLYSGDLTLGNDAVSSLIVPTGWTVWLMANTDCYGDFAQYTSSQSSLGSFNDETTCVVVQGP